MHVVKSLAQSCSSPEASALLVGSLWTLSRAARNIFGAVSGSAGLCRSLLGSAEGRSGSPGPGHVATMIISAPSGSVGHPGVHTSAFRQRPVRPSCSSTLARWARRPMSTGLAGTSAMDLSRGALGQPDESYANLNGLWGLHGLEQEVGGKLHPTLQLIVDRAVTGSMPGARTDPHKLGLVVEGGGMRGAVSAGMLVALYDLGLQRVFDSVYGSSAGAINLTYFLAGQREGVDVYANNLTNKDFIDLSRLWKRGAAPVLDLSFLLENVMMNTVPLDFDAVMRSKIPLKAVASCVQKLQPVSLEGFEDRADLLTCLKASANVPGIAGSPIVHRGHVLVDAAVFEPIPFPMAISDGCTHILACCSRPDPTIATSGPIKRRLGKVLSYAVRKAVLSPPYMKSAWSTRLELESSLGMSIDDILTASMDDLEASLPVCNGSHIYPIFPGTPAAFAPLCIDPVVINAGVQEGIAAVHQVLRGRVPGLVV